jgi:hypothetical protein
VGLWDGGGLGLPNRPFTQEDVAAVLGTRQAKQLLPQHKFVKPKFVPSGSIAAAPRTIGGGIQQAIAGLLGSVTDERNAARLGARFMAPLNDATPVGNITGAEEGGRQFYNGLTRGDLAQMGLGAASFGLSVMPVPGGVKRKAKGMFGNLMRDQSGAIRAWHGSPHDFDRFDMSKIGTGEGAQAYGHGLYFAEDDRVARSYQRALSGGQSGKLTVDGVSVLPNTPLWGALTTHNGDAAAALASARKQAATLTEGQRARAGIDDLLEQLETIRGRDIQLREGPGRLYEVNINAEPEDFLDWDRPLSEQPVQRKYADALMPSLKSDPILSELFGNDPIPPHYLGLFTNSKGSQAYNSFADLGRGEYGSSDPVRATNALRQAGVPGIRYLDQGSRGAGQGSHNFVVFDDQLVNILNKY